MREYLRGIKNIRFKEDEDDEWISTEETTLIELDD